MGHTVLLNSDEVERCRIDARRTFEIFRGRPGHYQNSLQRHFIGRLGELAAVQVIRRVSNSEFTVTDVASDVSRLREADIHLNWEDGRRLRLEVKTWPAANWRPWGRCIAVGQAKRVRAKSDAVIWVVNEKPGRISDEEVERVQLAELRIAGANGLDEILAIAPRLIGPEYRPVLNHQVAETDVRPLEWLLQSSG